MRDSEQAVTLAVAQLAKELSCAPAEISVEEARPVTWPNSALGCPKPGMMYLQVLTPGYQIRLIYRGQEHTMHTDRGHRAVRCPGGGIMPDTGEHGHT